jgi:hypothetical protein
MAPAEILTDLSSDEPEPPREALESADGHRPVLVEPLLRAIDCGLANPSDAWPKEATLFCYALYLLAKWREPRAYPYIVRWLSLPGEKPFDVAGDVVTQEGGRILAAVCDGDLEPIKTLIVDRSANEYGRSAGVTALALLAAWAEVPRESIVTSLLWLAREGLSVSPVKCGTVRRPTARTSKPCCCSPNFAVLTPTVSSNRSSWTRPNWIKSKRRLAAVCSK